MIASNETVRPGGWNQFLFAYKKDLFLHPNILEAPWVDGVGNEAALFFLTALKSSDVRTFSRGARFDREP